MTGRLVPCAGCGRHVKSDEGACPFCGAAPSEPPARALPSARLGRAATFAFGAALAAATTAGCSDSHSPTDDAGAEHEDAGPVFPDAAVAPPYGAPPDGGGIAPLYGGAPGD
jgi:hypothetical protein